ncbi:hypothetical protein G4B88_011930 [Cannabis sativa]|uniref:Uncharacterized protein n=1 Tax=Cannabis sativa TaxID=3483 RepID=A0A7J6HCZ6_CANSA|nr:hypothetical protein G4B88_011930 [Cannabis sativa]
MRLASSTVVDRRGNDQQLGLGSLRYPQKQGFCSLSLLQHWVDGFAPLVMAGRHELISITLQVTASATGASDTTSTTAAATTTITHAKEDNFLAIFCFYLFMLNLELLPLMNNTDVLVKS